MSQELVFTIIFIITTACICIYWISRPLKKLKTGNSGEVIITIPPIGESRVGEMFTITNNSDKTIEITAHDAFGGTKYFPSVYQTPKYDDMTSAPSVQELANQGHLPYCEHRYVKVFFMTGGEPVVKCQGCGHELKDHTAKLCGKNHPCSLPELNIPEEIKHATQDSNGNPTGFAEAIKQHEHAKTMADLTRKADALIKRKRNRRRRK